MRLLPRVFALFGLIAAFGTLIYAAGMIGRAIPTTVLAGRERDAARSPMGVLLIDYSRGLSIQRRFLLPSAKRADWEVSPPQVLLRDPRHDGELLSLYQFDFSRIQLEPLVTYLVPSNLRPWDFEAVFAGDQVGVYWPETGEVTLTDHNSVTSQRVSLTEESHEMMIVWSPDGTRLAAKDFRARELALLDRASARVFDTFRNTAPVWLADSRSILLVQDSFVGRNGRIRIIDAVTGETHPHTAELNGRSAAMCGTKTLGYVYIRPDSGVTLQTLDLESGRTDTVLNVGEAETHDVVSLAFPPRASCDWMLVEMRYPNALETRFYRLHIPSSHLTQIGDNVRILEVGADAVIYESTAADTAFTVRRAAFDAAAEPEIFGRIPVQYQTILWLDGYQRGAFVRNGQLWAIDMATGTRPLLSVTVPLRDLQLVPQE